MNDTSLDLAKEIHDDLRRLLPGLYGSLVAQLAAGACPAALKRRVMRNCGQGPAGYAAAVTIDYLMRVNRERKEVAR